MVFYSGETLIYSIVGIVECVFNSRQHFVNGETVKIGTLKNRHSRFCPYIHDMRFATYQMWSTVSITLSVSSLSA